MFITTKQNTILNLNCIKKFDIDVELSNLTDNSSTICTIRVIALTDMNSEKFMLNYFNTMEEAENFIKTIKCMLREVNLLISF